MGYIGSLIYYQADIYRSNWDKSLLRAEGAEGAAGARCSEALCAGCFTRTEAWASVRGTDSCRVSALTFL